MNNIPNFPILVFTFSFIALWLSALIGVSFRRKLELFAEDQRGDFGFVQAAILTLLGLLIGFTFSMAVSRYDQRKNHEEAEANALRKEYVRADLLPAADEARVRELLRNYLDQRVRSYTARDVQRLRQIDADTVQLQKELWSAALARGAPQPTPVVAPVVSGMNDLFNSRGYTEAASWNRMPVEAWVSLIVIAICSNLSITYGAHRTNSLLAMILTLAVSVSFFLIADIDSPRGVVFGVHPINLASLAQTLHKP
jgi:hypothetical protein